MPFTMRALDGKQSRLGLVECLNHGLLHPYPVLYEKAGELVAQVTGWGGGGWGIGQSVWGGEGRGIQVCTHY